MIRSYKEEQELKEKILELRKKNYPYDKDCNGTWYK